MYMKDDIDIFNQMSDIATNVSHLVDLSIPISSSVRSRDGRRHGIVDGTCIRSSISPVTPHQIGTICSEASEPARSAKITNRSSPSNRIRLTLQTELSVHYPESEQYSQAIAEGFLVGSVQFRNGSEDEGYWHVLHEVGVAAIGDGECLMLFLRIALTLWEVFSHELLVLDAELDDASRQHGHVESEWKGPCSRNGFAALV